MQTDSGGNKYENPLSPHKLFSQLSLPDFKDIKGMVAELGYLAEDKPLLPGIFVRAATVEKLASMAVECFVNCDLSSGSSCQRDEDYQLPQVLFLTHPWFVSSHELAELFLDIYGNCDSVVTCALSGCLHSGSLLNCPIQQYRIGVCLAVRFWILNYPQHFDTNPQLTEVIGQLQKLVVQNGQSDSELCTLLDVSNVPSFAWLRVQSLRDNVTTLRHSNASCHVTLVFNNLRPTELADQLTFLEYKTFRRITLTDFKNYAALTTLKESPKLERSIALFNGLSQWIQCLVLSKATPQQRASVIVKFVEVAKVLRQLNNFNTLMAVVGGLTHSCLARLTMTNSFIPKETQELLKEYTELLSSSCNFSNYRRALHRAKGGFRIPILGVHLKDLILLNTALPDRIDSILINFRKMVQLSFIFSELMQLQNNSALPIIPNLDLVNTIRLALDMQYTEDEIYELSLACEPRNSLTSPPTPTRPVVFAEWVAGISPPDPETINKHVHDMVEAVFKNYDHDKDGVISHPEFEAIAGNFPFIDSFAVLDANQDGSISKVEMKTYFIRANCHALRKCFKHDFHETTYFKPTFCIHCTGLLWGLIKQGWKCKECGINAHKHCKDLVVMECRLKFPVSVHGRTSFGNGDRNVTLASKRKMSSRQKNIRSNRFTQTDACSASSSTRSSPNFNGASSESVEQVSSATNVIGGRGGGGDNGDGGSDDAMNLLEKLTKAEQDRDQLMIENQMLRNHVELQREHISVMQSHINLVRQHTITFILDQMDTLHIQRDTEV